MNRPSALARRACSAFAAVAAVFSPAICRACSVCMSGASPDSQRAYFWGILLLLCLPFLLFTMIGGAIFYKFRKKAQGPEAGSHAA